jgi:hypothetical protein
MEVIDQWYQEYPFLKGSHVYERLQSYGFKGSYTAVSVWTQKYRRKKRQTYHELTFLPGEEAQVDWVEERFPWAVAYGFVMILTLRSIGVISASTITSFLLKRWGYRRPMVAGMALVSLSTILLASQWRTSGTLCPGLQNT